MPRYTLVSWGVVMLAVFVFTADGVVHLSNDNWLAGVADILLAALLFKSARTGEINEHK